MESGVKNPEFRIQNSEEAEVGRVAAVPGVTSNGSPAYCTEGSG